ncbi:glycosyl transferase, family 8 protein [Tanacetum coccineum]
MQEVILFYKELEVPTRQILDPKGAIPTMTAADAKVAIQEMDEHSQKWHDGMSTRTKSTKTSDGLAAIKAQLNNLGREIKKDCPLKEEGKTLEEAYYTQFGVSFPQGGQYRASTLGFYQRNNANQSYQEQRQSMEELLRKFMTESAKRLEENSNLIKEIRASMNSAIRNRGALIKTLEIQIRQMIKTKNLDAYSIGTTLGNNALPQKEKEPRSFTLPCYINNVCFEKALADLGASVSVMSFSTYANLGLGELAHSKLTVELADRTVKHPKGIAENILVGIELRRNQVDDLKPTIEECEVVNEPMIDEVKTRNDNNMVNRINGYPSYCDFDRKIHIDCAYNLQFSCMIVVENMDAYCDEGMGEVIIGEPFCKASYVEARRFDGMITIFNGNDSVTHQMVRSHPRFKHLTNKQCNKILPLLKVSEQDMMNRISHSYQNLKGFYKGSLDLEPEFIRDEKIIKRLTHGDISVHEME